MMKATDDQLLTSYTSTGSVWATAREFSMCGQSVYERLTKLGAAKKVNVFTEAEKERLEQEYGLYAFAGKLAELAADMGRTKHFICRQARALGMTDKNRIRPYISTWKYMEDDVAEGIWERFKLSSLGLGEFCKKHGFDDLGFSRTMREKFADQYEHVIELKAPKQTRYRLGRSVEYKARDALKRLGYFALRSPKSAGPIDVLAVKQGLVLFVQCKRGMVIGKLKEWNDLFELAESVGAIPLVCGQPERIGLKWMRITGLKNGTKRAQPWVEFTP